MRSRSEGVRGKGWEVVWEVVGGESGPGCSKAG